MLKTIRAKYKHGLFEPLEEVDLEEDSEVNITIDSHKSMSEEERRKRFLSSAGKWKDIVDEKILDEIYEQRRLRTRPEVKL
ncbi:MAG: antitoxin family protein [Candidatus Poribacteria bacterium]